MPDPSLWIRIGNRVPRVATVAIGLLALFGFSVIRMVLVLIPRDETIVVNGYLDGTAAGIAETRALWSPHWKLAFDRMLLDYSEDGSLTSDPHLVLSRDESILVVSRGGQLTDALDLEGKSNLVTSVDWDAPGREYAWALRTGQVETILKEHGGAAP